MDVGRIDFPDKLSGFGIELLLPGGRTGDDGGGGDDDDDEDDEDDEDEEDEGDGGAGPLTFF